MFAWIRSSYAALVLALVLVTAGATSEPSWPSAADASETEATSDRDRDLIENQPVCVASSVWSAGTPGESLLYHYRREGNRLYVGYFAHWSAERPWGANALTYTVVPALAVDMVYSHFMFVLPGLKSLMYGPGDIEGATVVYEEQSDGSLLALGGRTDDGHHRPITLSAEDLRGPEGRVVLTTDVWSHQLGVRGAAQAESKRMRCYSGPSMRPVTEEVAETFRMGNADDPRRAPPAWRLEAPLPDAVESALAAKDTE